MAIRQDSPGGCITVLPNGETYDASTGRANAAIAASPAGSCRRGGVGEDHVYAADVSLHSSSMHGLLHRALADIRDP